MVVGGDLKRVFFSDCAGPPFADKIRSQEKLTALLATLNSLVYFATTNEQCVPSLVKVFFERLN